MPRRSVTPSVAKGLLLLAALLAPLGPAFAHPLAPGLLELTEVAPARYAVLWRTSVARARGGKVEPRLPEECTRVAPPDVRLESGEAQAARWVIQCGPGGLAGRTLAIDGLEGSGINVIVRVVAPGQPEFKALLGAGEPAATLATAPEPVFMRYLELGAQHLLGGLDHLLFLLGLFLLVPSLRALVATVTAFTAGHSVTLSLAALGWVPIGQGPAELAIATTVLLLGLELARPAAVVANKGPGSFSADASSPKMKPAPFLVGAAHGRDSLLRRKPWLMAAAFGLVHGLGFAGALREIGLPPQDLALSLLAFNLGIESAQLALIGALLLCAAAWRRLPATPRLAPAIPAYLVGSMAVCWLLERSATLLA